MATVSRGWRDPVFRRGALGALVVCVVGVSVFFSPSLARAATFIPADTILDSGETHWTSADSPYIIEGGFFYVPSDASLVLEAGTVVKLGQYVSFYIDGNFDAHGSAESPVYITSLGNDSVGGDSGADPFPPEDNYASMSFYGSTADFAHASVTALSIVSFSHEVAAISGTAFDTYYGVDIFGSSAAIDRADFTGENAECLGAHSSTVSVSHSRLHSCYVGVSTAGGTSLSVSDSRFTDNATGVYVAPPRIIGATSGRSWLAAAFGRLLSLFINTAFARIETNLSFRRDSFSGSLYSAVENGSSETLNMTDNWWDDASGPSHWSNPDGIGEAIVGDNILFTPWLTADPFAAVAPPPPPKPTCCSNVLFLPGFQASRLYHDSWLGEDRLWEPTRPQDGEQLYMNSQGDSVTADVYTRDIISETETPIHLGPLDVSVYKSFITRMDGLAAAQSINAWRAYPYDWRYDYDYLIATGTRMQDGSFVKPQDILFALASSSKTGKVTIVAHSNGGLLGKALMMELQRQGKADLVDNFIMVAVPQLGTPQAIAGLLHGDETRMPSKPFGIFMTAEIARKMGEWMPGAHNLLPSPAYFSVVSDPVVIFDDTVASVIPRIAQSTAPIRTADRLAQFLTGDYVRTEPGISDLESPTVLHPELVGKSVTNHAALDSWVPPVTLNVYQMVGWGNGATLRTIRYYGESYPACKSQEGLYICDTAWRIRHEPVYTMEGDKTVVSPSASALTGATTTYFNANKYDVDGFGSLEHFKLFEASPILDWLAKLLVGSSTSASPYITDTKPSVSNPVLAVSIHSPVLIMATDGQGRVTGAGEVVVGTTTYRYFREEIPGSSYDEFGEGKYLFLDKTKPAGITIQGAGVGTFTVVLENKIGDTVVSSSTFADLPVTSLLQGSLAVSATGSTTLALDVNGDGTSDVTIAPSSDFDPRTFLAVLKATVHNFNISDKLEKRILKRLDQIEAKLDKDKTKQVRKQLERMVKNLMFGDKWKKLNQTGKETIVSSFEQLLVNL